MKPFPFFLVFLIIIGSASATFPITINGKNTPSSITNTDEKDADLFTIGPARQGLGITPPFCEECTPEQEGQKCLTGGECDIVCEPGFKLVCPCSCEPMFLATSSDATNVFKAQGFTSPIDDEIEAQTKGSIVFKRVEDSRNKAPKISQFFFFESNGIILGETSSSPTGAIVYEEGDTDKTGVAITVILFLCITGLAFIIISTSKIRIVIVIVIIIIIAFTAIKTPKQEPTGYTVQEFEEPPQQIIPQTHITNAFTLTWTNGGPITFFPEEADGEAPECSDDVDNADFEDALIDELDPGCHTDGDATNIGSYAPLDDLEQDMLEYDQSLPPPVDNQIDVYDIVNWIQYFDIRTAAGTDFSSVPLVHCTDALCTNNVAANCVGDVDPSGNSVLNAADIDYLQQRQLDDDNSVTEGICFNT